MTKGQMKFRLNGYKMKAKNELGTAIQFVKENPDAVASAIPLILTVSGTFERTVKKAAKIKEEKRRDYRQYDPSTGFWYELRRPLTNDERLRIDRLIKNDGKRMGDILDSMKVLK